jgi:antiviral helicase SLH1
MEPFWAKPFVKNKVEKLNLIQSIVYNVAFNTGLNMLVCAPTGAGKTNIALLTILHTLKTFATEKGTND